jgi:hypothetical protein
MRNVLIPVYNGQFTQNMHYAYLGFQQKGYNIILNDLESFNPV